MKRFTAGDRSNVSTKYTVGAILTACDFSSVDDTDAALGHSGDVGHALEV